MKPSANPTPLPAEAVLQARKARAAAWFQDLQRQIIASFEAAEDEATGPFFPEAGGPGRFEKKSWTRTDHTGAHGGGGTMALMRGRVFEKVGVHVSTVHGEFAPEFRGQIPGAHEDPRFHATGISLIAHPWNPNAPTVHMNTRFVVTSRAWFGGGGDLTPVLMRRRTQTDPDSVHFHACYKAACDAHAAIAPYDKYKAWCDEYFWLKHRDEPRGIGGVFFDDFNELGMQRSFEMQQSLARHFLPAYVPIVERRQASAYGEREREFQLYRRGRYVEFNLVWDRGTHFGLQSGGRTESILLSMPLNCSWSYRRQDPPGSPEARLLSDFLVAKDWV